MFDSVIINWIIAGIVLSILELFVPGVYLIWFGFAAFAVSIVVYFSEIAFTTQLIWFAFFSVIFALIGLFGYKHIFNKMKAPEEYRNLNNSAEQYIGSLATLVEDVVDNRTKVKVGDTVWLASTKKKLVKGDTVKIVGVKDSLILIVE